MNTQTIYKSFDVEVLPRWAQNDAAVVALCKRDLAFRINVCSAKTAQLKAMLKREAARRA